MKHLLADDSHVISSLICFFLSEQRNLKNVVCCSVLVMLGGLNASYLQMQSSSNTSSVLTGYFYMILKLSSTDFFKINFFEKFFQEFNQSVKTV